MEKLGSSCFQERWWIASSGNDGFFTLTFPVTTRDWAQLPQAAWGARTCSFSHRDSQPRRKFLSPLLLLSTVEITQKRKNTTHFSRGGLYLYPWKPLAFSKFPLKGALPLISLRAYFWWQRDVSGRPAREGTAPRKHSGRRHSAVLSSQQWASKKQKH